MSMTKSEKKDAVLNKQFEMAMDGSIEMLKWLGIQICGQDNKPSKGSEELPKGFDIGIIPSKEQEEFEENKELFYAWKMERNLKDTMEECKEGRRKYEEGELT